MKHTSDTADSSAEVTPSQLPAGPAEHFEQIPLARIRESRTNPRRTFHGLEELAASIGQKGIVEPLIVRPTYRLKSGGHVEEDTYHANPEAWPTMTFELVAGARRLRAATMHAEQQRTALISFTVPCMVRRYSDVEACEVQVIENNQREDVHPLEEADGFAHLVKLGQEPVSIAARLGRDPGYVARRLALIKLIEPARKLFEKEQIHVGHAEQLARLNESGQQRAMAWLKQQLKYDRAPSLADLKEHISRDTLRELSAARWKKDDVELLPKAGPCSTCLKSTANQRELFEDVDVKKPQCTDPDCYEAKQTAFIQLTIKGVVDAGEKPLLLAETYDRKPLAKRFGQEVLQVYSFNEISPKQAKGLNGKAKKAIVVDGDNAGKMILVSAQDGQSRSGDASQNRYKAQQRAAEKKRQRTRLINSAILDECLTDALAWSDGQLNGDLLKILVPVWFDRLYGENQKRVCSRMGWAAKRKGDYRWPEKACREYCAAAAEADLMKLAVLIGLIDDVDRGNGYYVDRGAHPLDDMAKLLGVKTEAIKKRVLAEQAKPAPRNSPTTKKKARPAREAVPA